MFTIKHCHDFREELYHSVTRVTADLNHASGGYGVQFVTISPNHGALFGPGPEVHHLLGMDDPDDPSNPPQPKQPPKGQRGTIFVMNEYGKTVAKYDL